MRQIQFQEVNLHQIWGPCEENDGGFVLTWSSKGIGFGELEFAKMKDGTIRCDNEAMGIEFIKAVFDHFLTTVNMDWVDGKYQRESKPASKEVREEIVKRIKEGDVQLENKHISRSTFTDFLKDEGIFEEVEAAAEKAAAMILPEMPPTNLKDHRWRLKDWKILPNISDGHNQTFRVHSTKFLGLDFEFKIPSTAPTADVVISIFNACRNFGRIRKIEDR